MMTAWAGVTKAQGAVIATRPARQPLSVMPRSGLPSEIQQAAVAVSVAAAAARLVVSATSATALYPISLAMPIVLPGLNPNQPNQRIKQPMVAAVMLCPGIALMRPSEPYLPMRGPRI